MILIIFHCRVRNAFFSVLIFATSFWFVCKQSFIQFWTLHDILFDVRFSFVSYIYYKNCWSSIFNFLHCLCCRLLVPVTYWASPLSLPLLPDFLLSLLSSLCWFYYFFSSPDSEPETCFHDPCLVSPTITSHEFSH